MRHGEYKIKQEVEHKLNMNMTITNMTKLNIFDGTLQRERKRQSMSLSIFIFTNKIKQNTLLLQPFTDFH